MMTLLCWWVLVFAGIVDANLKVKLKEDVLMGRTSSVTHLATLFVHKAFLCSHACAKVSNRKSNLHKYVEKTGKCICFNLEQSGKSLDIYESSLSGYYFAFNS